jgi:hypothetical protein
MDFSHTCVGVTDVTIALNANDVNKKPCCAAEWAADMEVDGSDAPDEGWYLALGDQLEQA